MKVNYAQRYYFTLKQNIVFMCKECTKNFPKNTSFPESFEFETINKQKQPEKKQFTTPSSLVIFYTNDFSDLVDKNTGSE